MIDFWLNPNVAYLFLVAGLFLALFAIITPGTGLLEISALFALFLAGWGIYNLPINTWAFFIMAAGVVPFILAIKKPKTNIFLGIAILAFILGSVFLFRGDSWWKPGVNPILALVTSFGVGVFFWIIATKIFQAESEEPVHDLGKLIGAIGEAKTDIGEEGTIQLLGELWTAHSEKPIPKGSFVRVIHREGLILDVEMVEEKPEK
ncbi:MAG TPA: hypothetical protein G4N95_01855 [Anaerolineae bacterium]|nr:hypothetical protein [Anaerolineae bacterium]